jgi:hypothetical protein
MRTARLGGWLLYPLAVSAAVLAGASGALLGVCGPFADFTDAAFCPFVLEIFTLGITTGTTPTTYDPASSVSRLQMAAFLSRSVDGVLKRGGRRTALQQFWVPQDAGILGVTTVGNLPEVAQSDGADVWVGNYNDGSVSRVRASDASLLETWTGAFIVNGIAVAMNRVLIAGGSFPGKIFSIDPSMPAGAVTSVASGSGSPVGITFDGARVWTANGAGSVSIFTPGPTIPWTATTVTAGIGGVPHGALFDGNNVWITNSTHHTVVKLDSSAAVLQTVTVGLNPGFPAFDGLNLWVPNQEGAVLVIRVSSGTVLQTLTGNGLSAGFAAAFDGERILVTNSNQNSVSLFKAADLTPLGTFPTGTSTVPSGACSDGQNFWITLSGKGLVARF